MPGGKWLSESVDWLELHRLGGREMQRLGNAALGYEPAHRSGLRAVDPDLDAGIVADRDDRGLQHALRARRELDQRHRPIVRP